MLELKNVTQEFGGIVANKDISFSIKEGSIVGLIGPNGAGKSTLFNVISAVYKPTRGEILFNGKRIDGLSQHRIATLGISRTFQNIQVFKNMSVIENVMIGYHTNSKAGIFQSALRLPLVLREEEEIYEKCLEFVKFVGMEEDLDLLAGNLPLEKLRLLELARALAVGPKLILLDEIAAGLNHSETQEMSELLRKVKAQGISVLVVEHDMDLVMSICDSIIVINQGEKIAEGTPTEIQKNKEVISAYLGEEDEEEESTDETEEKEEVITPIKAEEKSVTN